MRATKKRLSKLEYLTALQELKSKSKRNMIPYLNDEGLDVIGELTKNLIFCRQNLTPKKRENLKQKLRPFERAFTKIAKKRTPTETRRRLLTKIEQSGSGLSSLLLSTGIPILASLLFNNK